MENSKATKREIIDTINKHLHLGNKILTEENHISAGRKLKYLITEKQLAYIVKNLIKENM
jgi:hypothetical protein